MSTDFKLLEDEVDKPSGHKTELFVIESSCQFTIGIDNGSGEPICMDRRTPEQMVDMIDRLLEIISYSHPNDDLLKLFNHPGYGNKRDQNAK